MPLLVNAVVLAAGLPAAMALPPPLGIFAGPFATSSVTDKPAAAATPTTADVWPTSSRPGLSPHAKESMIRELCSQIGEGTSPYLLTDIPDLFSLVPPLTTTTRTTTTTTPSNNQPLYSLSTTAPSSVPRRRRRHLSSPPSSSQEETNPNNINKRDNLRYSPCPMCKPGAPSPFDSHSRHPEPPNHNLNPNDWPLHRQYHQPRPFHPQPNTPPPVPPFLNHDPYFPLPDDNDDNDKIHTKFPLKKHPIPFIPHDDIGLIPCKWLPWKQAGCAWEMDVDKEVREGKVNGEKGKKGGGTFVWISSAGTGWVIEPVTTGVAGLKKTAGPVEAETVVVTVTETATATETKTVEVKATPEVTAAALVATVTTPPAVADSTEGDDKEGWCGIGGSGCG